MKGIRIEQYVKNVPQLRASLEKDGLDVDLVISIVEKTVESSIPFLVSALLNSCFAALASYEAEKRNAFKNLITQ